mgnify:CR=1 FL=1
MTKGFVSMLRGLSIVESLRLYIIIGSDLFDVVLPNTGTKVEDVYLDNLVEVIDNLVEKTSNYEQRVQQEYAL